MNSAFQCAFCFRPGLLLTFLLPPPWACPHLSQSPATAPGAASERGARAPAPFSRFQCLAQPSQGNFRCLPRIAPALFRGQSGDTVCPGARGGLGGKRTWSPLAALAPTFGPACENPVTHFLTVVPRLPFSSCPRVSSFPVHLHLPAWLLSRRPGLRWAEQGEP